MKRRTYIQDKEDKIEALFNKQKGRCYWCELPFGLMYERKASDMYVMMWSKPILDHYIPYAYNNSNGDTDENFVASCEICNRIKSSSFPLVNGSETHIRKKILSRFIKRLENGKIIIHDEALKYAKDSLQIA